MTTPIGRFVLVEGPMAALALDRICVTEYSQILEGGGRGGGVGGGWDATPQRALPSPRARAEPPLQPPLARGTAAAVARTCDGQGMRSMT